MRERQFSFGRVAGLALCFLAALAPGLAHAHPLVDEARGLYEQAEFERALEVLARAEDVSDLSREELVALLDLRAELHLALGDTAAMERDVLQRVTLDPTSSLPASAPPEIGAAVERARGSIVAPIALQANVVATPGGVRIDATVAGDVAGLVRDVRVCARIGAGAWSAPEAAPLEVRAGGASVAYYVEAIGPGGAVLASAGTRSAPRTWNGAASGASDDTALAIGLGVAGGVVLVAIVVTLAVVLGGSGPSDQTQPGLPVIVSF